MSTLRLHRYVEFRRVDLNRRKKKNHCQEASGVFFYGTSKTRRVERIIRQYFLVIFLLLLLVSIRVVKTLFLYSHIDTNVHIRRYSYPITCE